MTRVGVLGARGRMGSTVVTAVTAAEDLELVAALDVDDDLQQLVTNRVDVVVDFTTPDSVLANITFCVSRGIDVVVGTSGLKEKDLDVVRVELIRHPERAVLVAPNFGVGAVLMMQFAAAAAPFFDSVEIVELHHPKKVDAPSGTARRTAELISEARAKANISDMPDATTEDDLAARGFAVSGVPVHSVRLQGLVAHQEVLLGGPGEVLTIRHDSLTRESFMPGVLLAVRNVSARSGLTVGLESLLGF